MAERRRLHLDADASIKALYAALLERGHDVTRTPASWIDSDAQDVLQLREATARDRCLFTFNVRDFMVLAERFPDHGGILLAAQRSWSLSELILALDRFLQEEGSTQGLVVWLNRWR